MNKDVIHALMGIIVIVILISTVIITVKSGKGMKNNHLYLLLSVSNMITGIMLAFVLSMPLLKVFGFTIFLVQALYYFYKWVRNKKISS